jgi:hydroxyacylglutathione hydrolase
MIVQGLAVGLLQANCYILGCEKTRRGVIIDPGDSARAILRVVAQQGLTIEQILLTHAHFDHIMAVEPVQRATGAPFALHPADLPVLRDAPERVSLWLDSNCSACPTITPSIRDTGRRPPSAMSGGRIPLLAKKHCERHNR